MGESPMSMLRSLLGYVENGTSTSITIGQDDATRAWSLKIRGGKTYFDDSLVGVIEKAYQEEIGDRPHD